MFKWKFNQQTKSLWGKVKFSQMNLVFAPWNFFYLQLHVYLILLLLFIRKLSPIYGFRCVKSGRIRSYSGPYSAQMRENTDQNNSEYQQLLRSVSYMTLWLYMTIIVSFLFYICSPFFSSWDHCLLKILNECL